MTINLNKFKKKLIVVLIVAFILDSVHTYGQNSNLYVPVNIDSLLNTLVILPDYNAYRICNYQFTVHYTGEIREMSMDKVSRFEQFKKTHPQVKFPFCNTVAVLKTKEDRVLSIGLKDFLLMKKLKPYDQPKDLRIKVKMLEGNFKAEIIVGLSFRNYIYRDFIIQDFDVIKN